MELRHLRYFVAVAEELHFGRAARRVAIAQPALSRAIRDLEFDVGAPLFERTTQKVQLTSAGAALLGHAHKLLDDSEVARRVAQRASHGEIGQVAVGFAPSASGGPVVARVVADFAATHPDVELSLSQVRLGQLTAALTGALLDVALVRPQAVDSRLEVVEHYRDDVTVALPAGHSLSSQPMVPLEALHGEHFLEQRSVDLFEESEPAGFHPVMRRNISLHGPDVNSVLALIGMGLGIAFVSRRLTETLSWNGVVFRPIAPPAPVYELILVKRRSEASTATLEFIRTAVRQIRAMSRDS